jgi:hypothetical protein
MRKGVWRFLKDSAISIRILCMKDWNPPAVLGIPVSDENEYSIRQLEKRERGLMTPTICRSCGQRIPGGEQAGAHNPNVCAACSSVPGDMIEDDSIQGTEAAPAGTKQLTPFAPSWRSGENSIAAR